MVSFIVIVIVMPCKAEDDEGGGAWTIYFSGSVERYRSLCWHQPQNPKPLTFFFFQWEVGN